MLSHTPDHRKLQRSHLKTPLGSAPPQRVRVKRWYPIRRSVKSSHVGVKGNYRPPELTASRVNSPEGAEDTRKVSHKMTHRKPAGQATV